MEPEDLKFLKLFNYYQRQNKIFLIQKVHKNLESSNCQCFSAKLKNNYSTDLNNIGKLNKNSNNDQSLFFIPENSDIKSIYGYDSYSDYKKVELNSKNNNFTSYYDSPNNQNLKIESNFLKLSGFSTTTDKILNTDYSINSKNIRDSYSNSFKNLFIELNENSNDFNNLNITKEKNNNFLNLNSSNENNNFSIKNLINSNKNKCHKSFLVNYNPRIIMDMIISELKRK